MARENGMVGRVNKWVAFGELDNCLTLILY